ncbi:hypothetical protein NLI96_g6086 [Meripilus lineatus]|uniref:Uncharacterized protein n=1 Tax=Meripilus lineatus TaxID=2056292 RepID=A0AAD5V1J3_9APHY|nr:hypothetical protein NLI96_g6086 [Physisporinus lineatus]
MSLLARTLKHSTIYTRTQCSLYTLLPRYASTKRFQPKTDLTIDHRALKNRIQKLPKTILRSLDSPKYANTRRYKFYSLSLYTLLRWRKLPQAAAVYSRMLHEGFLPPFTLQAVFKILECLSNSASEEALLQIYCSIFASGKGREYHLCRSLQYLCHFIRVHPRTLDSVVLAFLQTRPQQDYELKDSTKQAIAHRHRKNGSWEHARRWMSLVGDSKQNALHDSISPSAIVDYIRRSSQPNTRELNELLSNQFAFRSSGAGYITYRRWRQALPHILPDASTYHLLFRAATRSPGHRRRSVQTRQFKEIPGALTVREVFCDMLRTQHLIENPHLIQRLDPLSGPPRSHYQLVARPGLLMTALKSFMSARDYAGAYICLRTMSYPKYKSPITLLTYRAVLGPIIRRIQRSLPWFHASETPHIWWGYRFLGHPELGFDFDVHLLESVLRLGEQKEIGLTPYKPISAYNAEGTTPGTSSESASTRPLSIRSDTRNSSPSDTLASPPRSCNIPSALEMIGVSEPSKEEWDISPLYRILRRAYLATLEVVEQTPAKEVSLALVQAKAEMIPDIPSSTVKGKSSSCSEEDHLEIRARAKGNEPRTGIKGKEPTKNLRESKPKVRGNKRDTPSTSSSFGKSTKASGDEQPRRRGSTKVRTPKHTKPDTSTSAKRTTRKRKTDS